MEKVRSIDHKNVLEIRLHRPEVKNAFDPEMIAELTRVFKEAAHRKELRLVRLTAEGSAFCAGADLRWMKESIDYGKEKNEEDARRLFALFEAAASLPMPLMATVQGAAYGGAMGLIAACDVVVAGEKTKFCFSEVKLGIAPAVISGFVLRKAVTGLAAPAMMSGRPFSARRALEMGLVHSIVEESTLEEKAEELARDFLIAGPEAVRATKTLIQEFLPTIPAEFRELSIRTIAERRVSAEGQEGLKSFLEKREPSWRSS